MMPGDLFARWREAADRVEHALAAHEAALRAGDARLARAAESGFRARWAELVRASDRMLNYFTTGHRAGAAEPQALACLVRGWSRFVPPRLPRDAAHVRHFIAEARLEVERPARGLAVPGDLVVTCSQTDLLLAMGYTSGKRARFVEAMVKAGTVRLLGRVGRRYRLEIPDPDLRARVRARAGRRTSQNA